MLPVRRRGKRGSLRLSSRMLALSSVCMKIIPFPGLLALGVVLLDEMVLNLDLATSILDLCGAKALKDIDV